MRITIVPDDDFITVDGVSKQGFTFNIDDNIHAVQWDGTAGEVEYKAQLIDGQYVKPSNRILTSLEEFAPIVAAFTAHSDSPPPPPPAPENPTVSARQARLALLAIGKLDLVNAIVAQADQAAQLEWQWATALERKHPLLTTLAAAVPFSEAELDELFAYAQTL